MTKKILKDDLLEKIVANYTQQIRDGKAPAISAYQKKYPELAEEIDDLLTSVAMIEGLKVDSHESSQTNDFDLSELKQLGDYLLIREIGRGGMGIVFEAVHQSLGRRVAVKVMRNRDIDDEKYIARFRREARSAAKLHHTNIVSVFGVGEAKGMHYYVMEYIDGAGLNQVVQSLTHPLTPPSTKLADTSDKPGVATPTQVDRGDTPPSVSLSSSLELKAAGFPSERIPQGKGRFKWLAQVGAQVADALAYAHAQGILHRDIKPANLLLDQKDHVWITDFGLVKETEMDGLTKTGDLVGTPQYMAPESFKGEYDQRSETHCLGLTLYELATLQPAFERGTTAEIIHRVTTTNPVAPSKIDAQIPSDLNTIIVKAIARDPKLRYASAEELRDDLRAFAEDRPIAARKPSLVEQVWRWGRRNPLPATLAAISALLFCAFTAAVTYGWLSTNTAYTKLAQEAKQTEAARKQAVKNERTAIANEERIQVQFQRAESNVALTVQAFDEMFKHIVAPGEKTDFDIDGFQALGGIETAVNADDAAFLKQMMSFYQKFTEQNSENQSLLVESAKAFRRIANINYLIGETNSAVEASRKALEYYETVLKKSPYSETALLNVVNTRSELAAAIRRNGNVQEAHIESKKNIFAIESHPRFNSPLVQLALARSLISPGSGYVDRAALENASNLGELSADFDRPPPSENRRPMRRGLSKSLDQQFLLDANRAIEIGKQLCEQDADNVDFQMLLGKSYSSLAAMQLRTDDPSAIESLNLATEQFNSLSQKQPENLKYKYMLAVTYLLYPTEKVDEDTKSEILKIAAIADKLAEQSPNPEYKQLRILAHGKLSGLQLASGNLERAIKDHKQATVYLKELDQQVEGNQGFLYVKNLLHRNFRIIMDSYRKLDRENEARQFETFFRREMEQLRSSRAGRRGGWRGGPPPGRREGFPPPRDRSNSRPDDNNAQE
jgi:serine/threonine protein kinase